MNGSETSSLPLEVTSSLVPQETLATQSSLASLLNAANDWLWRVVPPVLLVSGCFGNVMTIVVMRAMRASESTACLSVYFTALAVSDLLLLLSIVLSKWPEMAFGIPVKKYHDVTCAVPFFLYFVTTMTSAWFLMAMTCQRMTSVILPHRVGVLCTVKRAKIVTAALTVFACVVCVQILFDYRVVDVDGKYKICRNVDEYLAYVFYYLVLIISSIIPFLFLIIANVVLIRGVLQSVKMSREMSGSHTDQKVQRSAKVSSMTTTLILTSVSFLLLTIPICIAEIYFEEIGFYHGLIHDEDQVAKMSLAETVVMLMWISNSAVNFYLYVLSGRKFREETKRFLCLSFQSQRT